MLLFSQFFAVLLVSVTHLKHTFLVVSVLFLWFLLPQEGVEPKLQGKNSGLKPQDHPDSLSPLLVLYSLIFFI